MYHSQEVGGALDGLGGEMAVINVGRHPIQSGGVGNGGIEGFRNSLPPHSKGAATSNDGMV